MKYTMSIILLITNLVNAALPETPSSYRWNPYSKTMSTIIVTPLPSQAMIPGYSEYLAPTPIDHSQSTTLSMELMDLLLKKIDTIARSKITSSDSQQRRLSQLQQVLNSINKSAKPLLTIHRNQLFNPLQEFLNHEYVRLGNTPTEERMQQTLLIQQYDQIINFVSDLIELSQIFSTEEILKLKCFHVSFLIGASNICGFMKKNQAKASYLDTALRTTHTITHNIQNPYGYGLDFKTIHIERLLEKKIRENNKYLLAKTYSPQ